ncbi:hypothetical protein KC19_2G086200, partial [Ceratodon purpureus]
MPKISSATPPPLPLLHNRPTPSCRHIPRPIHPLPIPLNPWSRRRRIPAAAWLSAKLETQQLGFMASNLGEVLG